MDRRKSWVVRLFVVLVLGAAMLVPAAGVARAPAAADATSPAVRAALKRLVADTKAIPHTRKTAKATLRLRGRLLRTATSAQRAAASKPCRSLGLLAKYRATVKQLKVKIRKTRSRVPTGGSLRGKLDTDALRADAALKVLGSTSTCGGGGAAKGVRGATPTVVSSTERVLKLHVAFPQANFAPRSGGGKDYTMVTMDGMGQTGKAGQPGVPSMVENFAVPEGAKVQIKVDKTSSYTLEGVNLFPRQPDSMDATKPPDFKAGPYADPPFSINAGLYKTNKPFPAKPVDGGVLGMMRDLRVGGLELDGVQYTPKKHELEVFTGMDVTVNFTGDNAGTFGDQRIGDKYNSFYSSLYNATLLNKGALTDHLRPWTRPLYCGEELLIVTSAALRPAANTLAAQRIAQGIATRVVEDGSGPGQIGTTNTAIQTYIRSELNSTSCWIHPSYVILFGNTAHVPTFLVPCGTGGDVTVCNIASDLPYSLNGVGTDLFADVMLGRLPSPDLANATALVAKLNTYGTTPPAPAGDDFYHHATTTAYFQPELICVLNEGASGAPNCDPGTPEHPLTVNAHWEINYPNHQDTRGFTITAEAVGNAMRFDGYAVDRLYTTDDEDVIPETYYNGTPIPAHLRRPTFAWNANSTDFLDAYNAGRFLILHRDHGWPDGWAEPTLHSGHVPLMTNGTKLPVVFGINCASAAFDDPSHPSFVELQVIKPDGGAVAGFGDTRVSPSFPNNHMTFGFFDAMFPSVAPSYGSPTGTRRLGQILVLGKQYMATQEGIDWQGAGDTYVEHYLYHLLGDPTMQMWADEPHHFDFSKLRIEYRQMAPPPKPGDPPPWSIKIEFPELGLEGTMVTLEQLGAVIGRGFLHDGVVEITPDKAVDPKSLSASFSQDGYLPGASDIAGPAATGMTIACPPDNRVYPGQTAKVEGTLTGVPTGTTLTVKATSPHGVVTSYTSTTVSASGAWSVGVQTVQGEEGTWQVVASYDGDSSHQPASSSCSFKALLANG
jgi:hypothetical protein